MNDQASSPVGPDMADRPAVLEDVLPRVALPLLPETHDQLTTLARENGWSLEEAARIALQYGLSALETPGLLAAYAAHPPDDAPGQAHLPPAERLLADSRAMYAAMKYRAFTLQQQVQTQALNIRGLQGKAAAWERWARQMRAQVAQLQAENAALRAHAADAAPPGPATTRQRPADAWGWLRRHFSRGVDHDPGR